MRNFILLVAIVASLKGFGCTNLLVGKGASADGSTIISYAADSYMLFGSLYHYPAAKYPKGTMRDVYEWDTGKYLGQIEEAEETYNVIGNINEFQLTIAETTFGGRDELVDTTGILDYGSLIYVTLQRAKTAREAIDVMTKLVNKYGYYSSGESFSIADPNEVWIMELIGKGTGNKGAVWVAKRLPDDCVSAHANHARITTIDFKSKDCLYSKDVISFAKQKGYFTGKDSEFSFSDAYAPLDALSARICEGRVWSFFCSVDSTMNKYLPYVMGQSKERMPLWIKPNEKLSVADVKQMMRNHYEGTALDMTVGAAAGNFNSPFRHSPLTFEVDSVKYVQDRPIATQQTAFSFVSQMRSWLPNPVGGKLWFGLDDATCTVYIPMYCGMTLVPESYSDNVASLLDFSWESAFWINNWVANMAYHRYSDLMPDITKRQQYWENKFDADAAALESEAVAVFANDPSKAAGLLTEYSVNQVENTTKDWKKLGEYLMVKFLDGVTKKENENGFMKQNKNIPVSPIRPGYTEEEQRVRFVSPNRVLQAP